MICTAVVRSTLANASCASSKQNSEFTRRKQLNESSWWWFRRQIDGIMWHQCLNVTVVVYGGFLKRGGTPKSSVLMVFSYIRGTPIDGNPHLVLISLLGTWSADPVSRPEPKKSDAWSGDPATSWPCTAQLAPVVCGDEISLKISESWYLVFRCLLTFFITSS